MDSYLSEFPVDPILAREDAFLDDPPEVELETLCCKAAAAILSSNHALNAAPIPQPQAAPAFLARTDAAGTTGQLCNEAATHRRAREAGNRNCNGGTTSVTTRPDPSAYNSLTIPINSIYYPKARNTSLTQQRQSPSVIAPIGTFVGSTVTIDPVEATTSATPAGAVRTSQPPQARPQKSLEEILSMKESPEQSPCLRGGGCDDSSAMGSESDEVMENQGKSTCQNTFDHQTNIASHPYQMGREHNFQARMQASSTTPQILSDNIHSMALPRVSSLGDFEPESAGSHSWSSTDGEAEEIQEIRRQLSNIEDWPALPPQEEFDSDKDAIAIVTHSRTGTNDRLHVASNDNTISEKLEQASEASLKGGKRGQKRAEVLRYVNESRKIRKKKKLPSGKDWDQFGLTIRDVNRWNKEVYEAMKNPERKNEEEHDQWKQTPQRATMIDGLATADKGQGGTLGAWEQFLAKREKRS